MELDALSGLSLKRSFWSGLFFYSTLYEKTLHTDVGAFLKISIVNISCTNK